MKHTIRNLLAIALLLLIGERCIAGEANDHLRPNTSYAVDPDLYERMLSDVFRPIYHERDLTLAVLITPSVKPERVVGIRKRGKRNEVVAAAARQSIWNYVDVESYEAEQRGEPYSAMIGEADYKEQRAQLSGSYRDVPLDTAYAPLDAELAKRIATVWQSALLSARQPVEPKVGLDGTTFTFSMWVYGYGIVSGSTWSPTAGSDMHSLVALSSVLAKFAKGQKSVADVELAVGECEKRLLSAKPSFDSAQSNGKTP